MENPPVPSERKIFRIAGIAAGGIFLLVAGIVAAGTIIARGWSRVPEGDAAADTDLTPRQIQAKGAQITSRIKALRPRGTYVLIDTAENRLRIIKDGKMQREAVVSCGSGDILQDPDGSRKWIFDTPRGEFEVTSKLVNPTWIKPDWAFIEEGEKVPTDYNERIDNDTLGDYALGFGEGFFIHGTLYTRLLGRNVTHGCVRVGDKDLKEVFQAVPMGAKIYIY